MLAQPATNSHLPCIPRTKTIETWNKKSNQDEGESAFTRHRKMTMKIYGKLLNKTLYNL